MSTSGMPTTDWQTELFISSCSGGCRIARTRCGVRRRGWERVRSRLQEAQAVFARCRRERPPNAGRRLTYALVAPVPHRRRAAIRVGCMSRARSAGDNPNDEQANKSYVIDRFLHPASKSLLRRPSHRVVLDEVGSASQRLAGVRFECTGFENTYAMKKPAICELMVADRWLRFLIGSLWKPRLPCSFDHRCLPYIRTGEKFILGEDLTLQITKDQCTITVAPQGYKMGEHMYSSTLRVFLCNLCESMQFKANPEAREGNLSSLAKNASAKASSDADLQEKVTCASYCFECQWAVSEVSSDGHEKLGKQALDMGDIALPIYGYKDK
ncbi:hypothetical protein C8R45DRAFT_922722 [Mycena sanguinolenta]|nr:hypothetical protein C8R45DRAFT_922722 [Mycena sanguinolenta]